MANENIYHLGEGEAVKQIIAIAQDASGAILKPEELKPAAGVHGLPESFPFAVRTGKNPELLSLRKLWEEYRTAPERRDGTARVTTLASFIDLVNRHKDAHSVLFAQTLWPDPALTAVIDYHQTDGAARFGQHRIAYKFPLTREFQAWAQQNQKPMGQAEFAGFVEDRIADLSVALDSEATTYETLFRTKFAVPTDLVELARGLSINVGSKVKNAFRTQSGEAEITFETEHTKANGEPLHVPGLFMLSLPVFVDGGEVRIPARLIYRVEEGKILWSYRLYKWEEALRTRVVNDLNVAAKQTELPAFEGAPEA